MNLNDELTFYGLLFDCPYGHELSDCPFCKLRRLPFEERYDIVEQIPESTKLRWIAHHIHCLATRQ